MLHSTPIFEAFGNARTARNANSSRFGKHMELLLSRGGSVSGARVHTYLLERTRVSVPPPARERNYHIFYYLAAAGLLPSALPASRFRVLADSSTHEPSAEDVARDVAAFDELRSSLRQLFMPDDAQHAMWALIGAILRMAEVEFEADERGHARATDRQALARAEEALGCPGIAELLTSQPMLSPRGGKSTYTIALDPRRAGAARDTICSELYRCIFDALVARINAVLSGTRVGAAAGVGDSASKGTPPAAASLPTLGIGLLDLFGFESFDVNSFEQLCINFANEAFSTSSSSALSTPRRCSTPRGRALEPIAYPDNKRCSTCSPSRPPGSFTSRRCLSHAAGDRRHLATQLFQVHANSPLVAPPRSSTATPATSSAAALRSDEGFVVRHFAGDVTRDVADFLRKAAARMAPEAEAISRHPPPWRALSCRAPAVARAAHGGDTIARRT